jgi:cytochrome c peroxidase
MHNQYLPSALLMGCLLVVGTPSTVVAQSQASAEMSASQLSAIKSGYRREPAIPIQNQALVDLGRELFFDPALSGSGNTSCASCHLPELGWGVKDAKSRTDSGGLTSRRSQTLLGIGHAGTAPIGWDGRNATLEAQAKSSIVSGSMSMQKPSVVKIDVIEERIRTSASYVERFNAAMPNATIDIDSIAKAIAAFERTIEPDPAPFDLWIEGNEYAISDSAKRGFALFNDKALCFACHRGWRFTDDQFHDIGTTTTDPGRGRAVKNDPLAQFAFKTPTLRDVALRPPYMHDGSVATLEGTVLHYERGGIERGSRSPLMQKITLTDQERQDLVAFMETLTGAVQASSVGRRN